MTTTLLLRDRHLEVEALPCLTGILLRGEADMATLPVLELALDILTDVTGDVILDLTELTFIDVLGCRALAQTAVLRNSAGHRVALRGAGTGVRRTLDLLGWAALFAFEPPEEPVREPAGRASGHQVGVISHHVFA